MRINNRIYGLFWTVNGVPVWTLYRGNLRTAKRMARARGAVLGYVANDPSIGAYDAPTFKLSCTFVADYTPR